MYLVENDMNAMFKKEADACVEGSLAYDDASGRLRRRARATARRNTIRVRHGKLSGFLLIGGPASEGGHPGGGEHPDGPPRQHRGAADQGASPVRRMR
jgi:hypothetical protein